MHNHKSCDCKHELKYCKCCDTVYCTKCSREWKHNYGYTWTYPYNGNYCTVGTLTTTDNTSKTDCEHK